MTLALSSSGRPSSSSTKPIGSDMPSGCGKSDPNSTLSAPMSFDQADRVLLVERVDVDAALERLHRVLVERLRRAARRPAGSCSTSGRTQSLPFSTGMIRRSGNRVARPWPMIDVTTSLISAVARRASARRSRSSSLNGRHLAVADALPLVHVALVAAVGGVHADDDVGLDDLLPERVELGQGERARRR